MPRWVRGDWRRVGRGLVLGGLPLLLMLLAQPCGGGGGSGMPY